MPLIEWKGLSLRRSGRALLQGLSGRVSAGEWLAIAGRNGSGKSTLLRVLLGLEQASEGEVLWQGKPTAPVLSSVRQRWGVVLQHPEDQVLGQTVLADVALGLPARVTADATWMVQREELLRHFGLWELRHLGPVDLSGGQRTLLALAAALLRQPDLMVLDEPFASLDFPAVKLAVAALLAAQRRGVAIIMVAHQLEAFLAYSHRLMLLEQGKALCDTAPEQALSFADRAGVHVPHLPVSRCSWLP